MKRVLITGVGGAGYGSQVLAALRLVSPDKYQLFGADARSDVLARSLVSGFADLPPAKSPNYVERLIAICEKFRIDAVFPGSEAELVVQASARWELAERGILLPVNRTDLIRTCMDKQLLSLKLESLGFSTPRQVPVTNENSLPDIDFFPVVVKPVTESGGSANVYIAQDRREAASLLSYLSARAQGREFIVQEYVGDAESEFTVGVLHDLQGNYIDSIALKRDLKTTLGVKERVANRSGKRPLGPMLVVSSGISQGLIGKFPEVTKQSRQVADALASQGPLNIQCRLVNGRICVFEINPRLSGTTGIRALAGFNEPDLLLRRHLLGEDIPVDVDWPILLASRELKDSLSELKNPS